jgi:Zn-dependent peptidase ImmA (M78 family)
MAKAKSKDHPIPCSVWSALGPVPVVMVKNLRTKKRKLMGLWQPLNRTIYVRAGMDPTATLATIAHEWVHVVLWDAGVALSKAEEEAVADAISTGIIGDLISRLPR